MCFPIFGLSGRGLWSSSWPLYFSFSQITLNSFYIFANDYLYSRFQFDTLQNSSMLIVFGAAWR